MRTLLGAAALALLLGGCANRLPLGAPARPVGTRFVRCEARDLEPCVAEPECEEPGRNKLTLYLGGTYPDGEDVEQTFGIDYERRFGRRLGAMLFTDLAIGEIEKQAFGVALVVHPIEPLLVYAGPGFEREKDHFTALLRVGAAWELEVGKHVTIGPEVFVDLFADEDPSLSIGIALGYDW